MHCKVDRVETIEFSCFNSVILYKVNLYKYEGRVYIWYKQLEYSRTK